MTREEKIVKLDMLKNGLTAIDSYLFTEYALNLYSLNKFVLMLSNDITNLERDIKAEDDRVRIKVKQLLKNRINSGYKKSIIPKEELKEMQDYIDYLETKVESLR